MKRRCRIFSGDVAEVEHKLSKWLDEVSEQVAIENIFQSQSHQPGCFRLVITIIYRV